MKILEVSKRVKTLQLIFCDNGISKMIIRAAKSLPN